MIADAVLLAAVAALAEARLGGAPVPAVTPREAAALQRRTVAELGGCVIGRRVGRGWRIAARVPLPPAVA